MSWIVVTLIVWLYLCGSFMAFMLAEESGSEAPVTLVWMLFWPVLTPMIVVASYFVFHGKEAERAGDAPRGPSSDSGKDDFRQEEFQPELSDEAEDDIQRAVAGRKRGW